MEGKEHLQKILASHQLRITECRIHVLEYFINQKTALSQVDLENTFSQYDRVTLYRTLNTFLSSGIIHSIPSSLGAATYGLCHETCSPDHHEHDHIHFKCNNCGQIECLDDKLVPEVSVPNGYQIQAVNLIVDGVCAKCA